MSLAVILGVFALLQSPSAPADRMAPETTPLAVSAAPTQAPQPTEFETYELVLLRRPETPREYPAEELEVIQAQHLAHLRHLEEAGKLLVAGPFADQPDPRLRGLALYRVGSTAEAKRLAEQDPAVKAGRLEVVVMTWYTEKGALTFPIADLRSKR